MAESLLLLELNQVSKVYRQGRRALHALSGITLSIAKGKTLGVVGESGCGKSTLGKIALGLEMPSSGEVVFDGRPLSQLTHTERRSARKEMQMIFQDPFASLDPRMTAEEIVGEGLKIHQVVAKEERKAKIASLFYDVGLDPCLRERYPHELSGGQRQRVGIARALAVSPRFLVCDEPLAALDVNTQKRIIELLAALKHQQQLTYLFISHDLHAVRAIADEVAVLYCGKVVEYAPVETLFSSPAHPYTRALLSSVPIADPKLERQRKRLPILGEPPSLFHPPAGCQFHPRCPFAMDICKKIPPASLALPNGSHAECHLY